MENNTPQIRNQYTNEDEISIYELFLAIKAYWKVICILSILGLILATSAGYIIRNTSYEARTVISFKNMYITEGKNPDGTIFDPYQIAAPYIIIDAINTLGLEKDVTANAVREKIKFTPIVTKKFLEQEKFSLEKEGKELPYYPSEFVMSLKVGGGISKNIAETLADQIVKNYMRDYQKKYMQAIPLVNNIKSFDADSYDYSDVSKVLHSQVEELIKYNRALAVVDSEYRSKRTGMAFDDIIQIAKVIEEIDLNTVDSLISTYRLTKDESRLIIYYEYVIQKLELEQKKLANQERIGKSTLKTIDNSTNKIINTLIGENKEQGDEQSYFNSIVLKTAEIGTNAAAVKEDIKYYQTELERLRSGEFTESKKGQQAEIDVKVQLTEIQKGINEWIGITNDTSEEYYNRFMSDAVRPLSPAEVFSGVKITIYPAIGVLLGLMIGFFYAFIMQYVKHEKEVRHLGE